MPGISMSGNMSPQSRSMILPSTSMHAQFRPISPRPPRKTILTGSSPSGKLDTEVSQDLAGLVFQPVGSGAERQAALSAGEPEDAEHGLGRDGVRREVAGL